MKKCAVVIPVYKQNPSEDEIKSISQCFRVLNKHDIIIVCPENLEVSAYVELAISFGVSIRFIKFAPENFISLDSYNQMMLNSDFYKKFEEYEYILIYQLDSWTFKDELELWCDKGYDYVGAPWFETDSPNKSKLLKNGGNGGFSLRKISSFLQVLSAKQKYILNVREVFFHYKKRKLFSNILSIPQFLYIRFSEKNRDLSKQVVKHLAEDYFYAFYAKRLFPEFKVAKSEDAMYFSFETHPAKLYEMTNQLPFGCHKYKIYDYDFWKKFI